MKTPHNQDPRRRGSWASLAAFLLGLGLILPASGQYEFPLLLPGAPNPFTPTNAITPIPTPWNRNAAYTPGGGERLLRNDLPYGRVSGYTVQNRIGTGVVPLNSQYGVGDVLLPPGDALALFGDGWVPYVVESNGAPWAVQWLHFANTNLFVAVDEGVAVVIWTNALAATNFAYNYVIGPNLSRRPVRLFWTEGQYAGPRVRFGSSYKVNLQYNNQIPEPTAGDLENIALEKIDLLSQPTVFLKNGELRAASGAKGRICITYSRRPEGSSAQELLGFEVVDVLEPMSGTIAAYVGDRLLPRNNANPTNALFCDVTRGGLDQTGVRPDEIFAYKHMVGRRAGWVWAIRPTDAPWQLEIFWKAKEQLDVIWPFEVDIYDVKWNPLSQLCAMVDPQRSTTPVEVYMPQQVLAEVMPYQGLETHSAAGVTYPKAGAAIARVSDRVFRALLPGICTLKYTVGEDVWFEPVRTVRELSEDVYQGVQSWSIGEELRPFLGSGSSPAAHYDEWPGLLRIPTPRPSDGGGITNIESDLRWDRYHPDLYSYPVAYPNNTNGLQSQIFAVNIGHLSAWWWNPTALVKAEEFPVPIYWPSLVCDYRNEWPEAAPQIVIASFQGSSYGGLYEDGTAGLLFTQPPVRIQGVEAVTNSLPDGWGNPVYRDGFTFETWIRPSAISGPRGIMAMTSASGTNALSLLINDTLIGAAVITYGAGVVVTQEWFATASVESNEWAHVGLVYGAEGSLEFYLNGEPAGTYTNVPAGLGGYMADSVELGIVRSFTAAGARTQFGPFQGWMDETRMWDRTRVEEEMWYTFAAPIDDSTPGLVFRFDYDTARLGPGLNPLDRTQFFYISATKPGFVDFDSSRGAFIQLQITGKAYPTHSPKIYVQNDADQPGYNPNEEHALMAGATVYALRMDLNITKDTAATSLPFTLVEYTQNPNDWRRSMDVYSVVATNRDYPRFIQRIEAGRMIQPPYPLRTILPDNCTRTYCDAPDVPKLFRDRLRYWWAKQAGNTGTNLAVGMRFFYPVLEGFWFPQFGKNSQPAPLTEIPWLSGLGQTEVTQGMVRDGTPVRVTFDIRWPRYVPTLSICDTLTLPKNYLPAVRGQKSVRIVYQQSVARADNDPAKASGVLIDPTRARKVALEEVPPAMRAMRDPRSGNTFFSDLDPDLRERLYFVPTAEAATRLQLKGIFVEYPNYHYLRLNLMTPDLYETALNPKRMVGIDEAWTNAVNALPSQRITMTDENEAFDSLALCTPGFGAGYVTLLFNNSTNIDMVDPGDPIDMAVIYIQTNLFAGRIDIIESKNPLDKYMTLRHISDFAGEPQNWEFQWQWAEPENGRAPATNSTRWTMLIDTEPGRYTTVFGSSGEFGLADNYVRCRYRALDNQVKTVVGTNWSEYTDPVLCEGWIKRVLKAINPYDQRIRDYMNYSLNMQLSMIQQAGQPYSGDIPLNLDALNEYGLIPIYQTVLEQSRGLSIDATLDPTSIKSSVCLALLLAAGRLNDLYMVLGNEAYADAMNPSISLGTDPVGSMEASSIFAFQNIVPTLLDEELALLRGRDCTAGVNPPPDEFPIYNRLPWNLTADITHGQPAYILNYGISDLKGDQNGVVDAMDAAKLFPQGHGDAWGHYLSAVKSYYYLWRHRNFTWFPQLEGIRVGTVEVTMSALHEVKFAAAAAAKARTGVATLERTYARVYEEGSPAPWAIQRDTQPDRSWGVGEWGARVGMGAYFDWVMANALLPDISTGRTNPVEVIDRTTVPELTQIVLAAGDVQQLVDMADRGVNPLGLAPGAVPFDISPAEIDLGKTHFEQAYGKAQEALRIARGVYDRIQACTAAIRDQNEQRELDTVVLEQEQAYERQLIDIYGYPYQEDIGPGKLYPEGYLGPDLAHYNYINRYDYFGRIPLDGATIETALVVPRINGVARVAAGTILPRPPPAEAGLTIEDILLFVDSKWADEWEAFKEDYGEVMEGVEKTREGLEGLGISELVTFYDEVYGTYTNASSAVIGAMEDVISFFDGAIGAPVDEIDQFISEWVGPETELRDVNINVPDILYATNHLIFWVGADGLPTKPADYVSNRRAEGEIQVALSQYVLHLRELSEALNRSRDLYQKMLNADEAFRSTVSAQLSAYYAEVNSLDNLNTLQQTIEVVNKSIALVNKVYDTGMEIYEALDAAIPAVMGMAFDVKAAIAGIERAITAGVNAANLVQKLANQEQIVSTERDIEINQRIIELNGEGDAIAAQSYAKAQEVIQAARDYLQSLDPLDVAMQKAETARMQYSRAIAAGDMIQIEREQARRIWATDLTGRRYRNMAYQIMRNDDLVRFDQTFAMARRYVYLAAKAYDYETGLLRHDGAVGAPGREFLSQIVRARALGRFTSDGTPLPGGNTGEPGLADIMARMSANWSVLDGRLNFNNPQVETGTFSLRKELFRIPNGGAFDRSWRDILATCKVADVRSIQEYRTHCLPFNPTAAAEPALVIPFSTTINFRENFFGLPLAAGDNAYDSTHFATKVRGIGVWFSNYQNTTLANQPRVYLVPLGQDRLRVPDGVGETIRSWSILDQALPIPYPLSNESWMRPDWNVRTDVLGGEFFVRRRLPSMRAYHDSGFNLSEMTTNSRLIGRSVWNTRWLLIIPGGTLLADADKGIEQFIRGRELAPGSETYDGEGVTDIKLQFLTYSYSGN